MSAAAVREITARDLQVGDVIVFEKFVRGRWVTVECTVASVEHLVTIDWRRVVRIVLEGADSPVPIEYAARAPVNVR